MGGLLLFRQALKRRETLPDPHSGSDVFQRMVELRVTERSRLVRAAR
jgi:hypothetical protein